MKKYVIIQGGEDPTVVSQHSYPPKVNYFDTFEEAVNRAFGGSV